MNINQEIEQVRNNIVSVINNSNMPIGVVYYVMKDIMSEIELSYQKVLVAKDEDEDAKDEDEGMA